MEQHYLNDQLEEASHKSEWQLIIQRNNQEVQDILLLQPTLTLLVQIQTIN